VKQDGGVTTSREISLSGLGPIDIIISVLALMSLSDVVSYMFVYYQNRKQAREGVLMVRLGQGVFSIENSQMLDILDGIETLITDDQVDTCIWVRS